MRNLRDLFPEDISDETAYHLGNFLYELALAFEAIHLGQIMRYNKSRTDVSNKMKQDRDQDAEAEKERQDLPF